jgi:hypothetical protein
MRVSMQTDLLNGDCARSAAGATLLNAQRAAHNG